MGRKIISNRPYSTKSISFEYAEQLSQMWSWQEIVAALATHPKLVNAKLKTTQCKEQDFSNQEQAGIS